MNEKEIAFSSHTPILNSHHKTLEKRIEEGSFRRDLKMHVCRFGIMFLQPRESI